VIGDKARRVRMSEQERTQVRRKKKKEARKDAALLLKRLRKLCETLEQINEWHDIVKDVEELLSTHDDVIPAAKQQRIREILALPQATLEAANQACSVLQTEIKGLTEYLAPSQPASGPVMNILATGLIVVAAIVFALTLASNLVSADIRVDNVGCGDLNVKEALRASVGAPLNKSPVLRILGITLPAVVVEGERAVISVPPIGFDLDNQTEPNELRIRASGLEIPLPIGTPSAIEFDGESLLGRQTNIRLRARGEHTLIIRCDE
jgi:hypothetical protein